MARITPKQLDLWSAEMSSIYQELEIEIIKQVIKRFKIKGSPDMLRWQMEKMHDLGLLNREVYRMLANATGVTEKQIERAVKQAGYSSVADVDEYLSKHMPLQPPMTNLDQILQAYSDQTFIDIGNKVNQTLVSTQYGHGAIAQGYTDVLNNTVAKFNTGMLTRQEALEQAIREWARKGVLHTFIDKGGNTWSLERYVDTVLKSTLNRTYNELRASRMEEYGIHTVRMSEVYDPAPRCASCQGRVLDMRPQGENDSGYPSIYEYGYGEAGGTLGINCRHSIYPFIPGVNIEREPTIDKEVSKERYKYRERQRELERRIRRAKKDEIISNELGTTSAPRYREQIRDYQAQMRELMEEATWLRRNYGREKVVTPTKTLMSRR